MICTRSLPFFFLASSLFAEGWNQFRGNHGNGHAQASDLPTEWSETKNVVWKTPIPHSGWSTPVIWANQIWLTSAPEDGKESHVFCLDREKGTIVYQEKLWTHENPEPLGNKVNGYASCSAAIEDGRVYIHFGSYGTCCIDTKTFQRLWERRDLPCRHYRGPGSSVVLYKDTLIVSMDGVDVQYLTALNKKTGQNVWRADRPTDFKDLGPDGKPTQEGDVRKAYTTPLFIDFGGKTIMVSSGAKATYGYNPDNGKVLWNVLYTGFSNAASPVFGDGLCFINTGYSKANLLAVPLTADSQGDLTATTKWELTKRVPLRSSNLFHQGILYMVDDGGQASAIDAATGEEIWNHRLEGNYSGSPILADGKIYVCNEQGKSYVLTPGKEFKIIGENTLAEGMLASPVAVGKALYLRTKSHLYRIEKR